MRALEHVQRRDAPVVLVGILTHFGDDGWDPVDISDLVPPDRRFFVSVDGAVLIRRYYTRLAAIPDTDPYWRKLWSGDYNVTSSKQFRANYDHDVAWHAAHAYREAPAATIKTLFSRGFRQGGPLRSVLRRDARAPPMQSPPPVSRSARLLDAWRRTLAGTIAAFYAAIVVGGGFAMLAWLGPRHWTPRLVLSCWGYSMLTTWNAVVLAAHAAVTALAYDAHTHTGHALPAWVHALDEWVLAPNVLLLTWITAYGVVFIYMALDDRSFWHVLRVDGRIPELAFAAGDGVVHVTTLMAVFTLLTTSRARWLAWTRRHLARVDAVAAWTTAHVGQTGAAILRASPTMRGALWTACLVAGSTTLSIAYMCLVDVSRSTASRQPTDHGWVSSCHAW